MSGDLTKLINTVGSYPFVRAFVLTCIAVINHRLEQLVAAARKRFSIKDDKPLVRFYMKGGNAFVCVFNPQGPEATTQGGGNSDWDTQAIVDPWAPREVQDWLYGMIEDIVLDEMRRTGVAIAKFEKANADSHDEPPIPKSGKWPLVDDVKLEIKKDVYTLTLDNPQTIRKIFDYNRLGLWFNDSVKLSDEDLGKAASQMIPGIILNDSIQPFKLYRMGYTWHAVATEPPPYPDDDDPTVIDRPVLMELIDVTLPRRNTIEAVAVWDELENGTLAVSQIPVAVRPNPQTTLQIVVLPMPGIFYHLVEISTMLCEIADGSSHHADKLQKRFERFKLIVEMPGLDFRRAVGALSQLVGVPDIMTVDVPFNDRVTQAIATYARDYIASTDRSILLARKVMDIVANRPTVEAPGPKTLEGRAEFAKFLSQLGNTPAGPHILSVAYSDDLVLLNFLLASQYINIEKVKWTGIANCLLIRVKRYTNLTAMKDLISTGLKMLAESQRVLLDVHFREHNTVRPEGATAECTLVAFVNGRPNICITITNATPEEAPFHPAPDEQRTTESTLYCAPAELAIQRKVAAALIEDYSVRAAFANQYEILKALLPGI